MRVLQINSVCGYGSTGRIATDLYNLLEENGHECLIAYGRGTTSDGINSYRIGTKFDNYLHVAETRLFDLHGFASTSATKKFIKNAKKYNPDVIHLHNIHGYYINIELLFSYLKEANKPIVWTLHDCWAFTGHCSYFDYVGCEKWKTRCYECPQKNSYPASRLLDKSKHNYEKKRELFTGLSKMNIVTPSKWLAGLVKESFLREYEVQVIHNGIDLDVFKPTKSDFRKKYNISDKFIILGVASVWDRRKGLEDFIKLAKILSDDSIIVLVGLSTKQMKNLPKNIIGIKRTGSVKELAEIYTAANVFFNPTYEDNYPTTNLEAIACGTPVVTYNTGGSPETIDRDTGIVLEKGNVEGLKKVILKIMAINNLKMYSVKMSKQFNKDDKFNDYIKLYSEVTK